MDMPLCMCLPACVQVTQCNVVTAGPHRETLPCPSACRIGISPDSFEPWGYSLRQMVQWAFEPADEATVAALIDKGAQPGRYLLLQRGSPGACWPLLASPCERSCLYTSARLMRAALHSVAHRPRRAGRLKGVLSQKHVLPLGLAPALPKMLSYYPDPAGKEDAQAWMESMDLGGEAAEAEAKKRRDVGAVAASKEAAVGGGGAEERQQAQAKGWQQLEGQARGEGPGAVPLAAAPEAAAAKGGQAAGGEAADAQRQAVEAAAAAQDAGASREEQEEVAAKALREAEEREGEGGNIWARALGAAGVAASAAAVAAAVAGSGV